MTGGEPWQYVLGSVVAVLLGYLTYRGGLIQAAKASEGVARSADVAEQESALQGWKDLLEPYRVEVREVRTELTKERQDRAAKERQDAEDRAREKALVQKQMAEMAESIEALKGEVRRWKSLARVIARWATTLRDQVLTLGGTVPATPDELLLIQVLDDDSSL